MKVMRDVLWLLAALLPTKREFNRMLGRRTSVSPGIRGAPGRSPMLPVRSLPTLADIRAGRAPVPRYRPEGPQGSLGPLLQPTRTTTS